MSTSTEADPNPDKAESQGEGATTPKPTISRKRLIGVDVLIGVTTLLAVVGMLAVYANRLLFNPNNWENASVQLLQNPDIRSATANYIVDQVYANVDVPGYIQSVLPPRLQGLAPPVAGAVQNAAVSGVELALTRPRVQQLWAKANRAADQTFIAVVEGGKGPVGTQHGVVTLDLASIVNQVAARLGLPSNLGAKLPPNVATLTVFKSNQLKAVQNIGNAVKSLALWLTILVPLLYGLAIVLARHHRRRTLMTVGFAFVLAGIVGFALRRILITQITDSLVSNDSVRPAVHATVAIGTQILATIAGAFVLVGLVLAAAAWFAGPMRLWVATRRAIAPFLREQPVGTFAITAAIMLLVFIWNPIPATGTAFGIIVFTALAMFGTEMLRRQTAAEFPDARRGEATAALRARVDAWRDRRQAAPAPASESIAEQLEQLSALHERGSISNDEYQAAKSSLLSTTPAPASGA
jgi:hypothetical protein